MRSTSPSRKRKYVPKQGKDTTSQKAPKKDVDATPRREVDTTRPGRGYSPPSRGYVPPTSRRPPNKQQMRSTIRSGPSDTRSTTPLYQGRAPRIGEDEASSPEHVTWIRNTWSASKLFDLWDDLAGEREPRRDLIAVVERQLIRAQLRDMMGKPIATRANIQVDGEIDTMTKLRDVDHLTRPDTPMRDDEGTYDQRTVWNSSLKDAEVDTIRDIRAWADRQTRDSLLGRTQVKIQIPGTSGPCDACKRRITKMADEILESWVRKGVPRDKLPQLLIESYYGNPTRVYDRRGVPSRNGWSGDRMPTDLDFVNRARQDQFVRTHEMYKSPRPVPTTTTTEESGSSEDMLVTSK